MDITINVVINVATNVATDVATGVYVTVLAEYGRKLVENGRLRLYN
jgi:hypothetical protein